MVERRKPIQIGEAVQKVMEKKLTGEIEYVTIHESFGRHLAADLVAKNDVPHFDRAAFDGYAVRSVDTKTASREQPLEFEVIDHIGAGAVSNKTLGELQAVRIMTGAQLPEGADAVVMLELAKREERDGKQYMTTSRPHNEGDNVSYRGEDAVSGQILIEKGVYINPGVQAMLATFGYAEVPVAKKPLIGLFATGTELLDVDDELQPGKIRNSNSYMISAQIERVGADVKYFGQLPDEFDTCFDAVEKALEEVDLLITTGGVSVGDFDYMSRIYNKLGADILFNKVAMRPGSVTTVAHLDDKFLFGLSGNPSACYVGFELFARPIVRTMLFSNKPHMRKERGVLAEDFPKINPFTRFVRSTYTFDNGKLNVAPSGRDKSNIIMSLADANALTILPGGTRGFKKGDEVEVLLLEDLVGSEWPW